MNLAERYEKETGLKANYGVKVPRLIYNTEYVWWLEQKIQDAKNCLMCASISNTMEVIENTYKILKGR